MPDEASVEVLLAARAGVYRVLQNLLGNEPNNETLAQIKNTASLAVLQLFSEESTAYTEALNTFLATATIGLENEATFLAQLESGFTHLFVGPGKVEVYPWESTYSSNEAVIFQASTLSVRKAYVSQGFIPQNYPHVADDHIALELDFMAQLADKLSAAYIAHDLDGATTILEASQNFLNEHLAIWVEKFASSFDHAQHPFFYLDIANLLAAFIPVDQKIIDELRTVI
jgi:TorA maturation chaperone TorD